MSITEAGWQPAAGKAGDCGCGGADPCAPDGHVGLERTRWFRRMLVGPDDLIQDQRHELAARRRHNRLLHGWGVVCGLRVAAGQEEPCKLVVEAGFALGPWGHEIVVPKDVTIDACAEDMDGNAAGPCGDVDPWCTPVRVARNPDKPLYLAIRYAECDTRPVRVFGAGCGCDEAECEYSRTRDSYTIKLLTELPKSHRDLKQPDWQTVLECPENGPRPCPPCPDEPWIVLADIRVTGDQITQIDCISHRRYVVSFAELYVTCTPAAPPPPPPPPPPALPPVILAHWPPNGANLATPGTAEERQWRESWQARKRVEITFDHEMDPGQLAEPDNWLRVWRVADLFEFIPGEKVQLTHEPEATSTLGVEGFTAVFDVGELEPVGGPIRYLVQVRSEDGAISNAAAVQLDLDADFDGTSLPVTTRNTLWDGGFQTSLGRDDWDALVSSGATLPASGDGSPGGSFSLTFDAPKVG